MHSWAQFDPENVLLNEITKGRKRYAVRKFVHDLTQAKIWHGKKRVREYPAERKPKPKRQDSASPRKRKRASPSSSPSSPPLRKAKSSAASPIRKRPSPPTSPLQPKMTRSQVQREEAEAKKAQEAEATASVGLRRSTRERKPTKKALE
jgi:hypothetical protein